MAFVYQTQRWTNTKNIQTIGPGYYRINAQSPPKGGVITPDHKSSRKLFYKKWENDQSDKENLKITQQFEEKSIIKNQTSKKHIRNVVSAKPRYFKREEQNKSPLMSQNQNIFLQIANSNNTEKKEFQNSRIKTSFKKNKQLIHSNSNSLHKTNLFNDKNMRLLQDEALNEQRNINLNYLKNTLKKSSKANINLKKFVSNVKKYQNVFSRNQKLFDPSFQEDNFIIASGNCKLENANQKRVPKQLKRQSDFNKFEESFDLQTTAMDDSYQSSFQYITVATPGPGQYNLRKDLQIHKNKVQKFGTTQKRFINRIDNSKVLNLNIKIPTFKKSSKASQEKVSFGKTRPTTAKQPEHKIIFYQNNKSIQNQCLKDLIKDRSSPGTFLSKCSRFESPKRTQYTGPDFFQKDQTPPIQLPHSIFMSCVERQQRPLSPTPEIDYHGQDYKTIQSKIQRIKQKDQIIDVQTPGFHVSAPRFKYKQNEQKFEIARASQLKNQKRQKQIKAFTFRKDQLQNTYFSENKPDPWTYQTKSNWIKPSHHVKYKF